MQKNNNKNRKNTLLSFTSRLLSERSGFTLIELLVTITLIGIIGTITSQAFILGINSQAKSETLKEVKQNGDFALSVVEAMVRNARDIQGSCNNDFAMQDFTIVNRDGLTTTFDCSTDTIASISGQTTGEVGPTPTGVKLTNNKVTVSNCNIRLVCPTPPLSPKYVYIYFTVSQSGSGLEPENRAAIDYQTTVSLRDYR